MKNFSILKPEVAGNIDNSDFIDAQARPPLINKLRYEFDGWLGDDILSSVLIYIVTDELRNRIEKAKLTGIQFDSVEVSASDAFKELYPGKELPHFHWMKVIGQAGVDDFGIAKRLVISDKALDLLKKGHLNNAIIEPFN